MIKVSKAVLLTLVYPSALESLDNWLPVLIELVLILSQLSGP